MLLRHLYCTFIISLIIRLHSFLPVVGVADAVVVAVVECDVCDDDGDGDAVEDALDLRSTRSSGTRCCCTPGGTLQTS